MGMYRLASNDNAQGMRAYIDDFACDRQLADAVTNAAAELQHAMDDAIKAGLLVEPSFETVEFCAEPVETETETYVVNLQIFRELL